VGRTAQRGASNPRLEWVLRRSTPLGGHTTRSLDATRSDAPVKLDSLGIVLLLCVVIVGLFANIGPVANNDIGFHLRLGQEISTAGPPVLDHHSFTASGAPYPDHEWLAQLGLWAVDAALGIPGLVLVKGLLIGATLAVLAFATGGPPLLRAAVLLPVFVLAFDHGEIRPHLLSWLYLAVLGGLLERRRHVWVLGLLWLWANTHASVGLGVLLACLAWAQGALADRSPRALLWAIPTVLIPLLNPYGSRAYLLVFDIGDHVEFIDEWLPYATETWQFGLLVALVGLAGIGILRRRFDPFDGLRLLVLATMAFQASRFGVVMAIVLAPCLVRWFGADVAGWARRTRRGLLLGVVLTVAALGGWRWSSGETLRLALDREKLPVAAVEFLQRHSVTGPVFNDYNFGGYLLWKAPELPVFIDGRVEVYPGPVIDDYLRISTANPGWEALAGHYPLGSFVMRPERPIVPALLEHPDWELVYFDYNSVIFVPAGRYPELRRLLVIGPFGHRVDGATDAAITEMRYLLAENPLFFGGHKVLAYSLYRSGDAQGAARSLDRYLELHPSGWALAGTQELVGALVKRGAWPPE
jgi:hypothetical protein